MFKKLVPVLGALLIAGPVFAADTAAPSQDQSASAPAKHKKHHKKHTKKSDTSSSSSESSSSPK